MGYVNMLKSLNLKVLRGHHHPYDLNPQKKPKITMFR